MKPFPFRGAIFDLDGTLFDSMHVWTEVDNAFLRKRGIPMPSDYHDEVKSRNFPEAAAYTKTRFSLPEHEEEIMREWFVMTVKAYANDVLLKPFAREFLSALREQGIKTGIATSSKQALYTPVLERCGIANMFDTIVTTEQTKPKSFPDVYLETAKRLGVAPNECAVFEDILVGIKSAKTAGFYAVAVQDHTSLSEQDRLRALADRYIVSFAELL
ncbi:MAG: HAD family phosphatase [Clostridia bacterium]|jgi:HAD superfamily hydrolase (TIGR01509 family)|nr:HAD family phosphatase [Clostridia bacterium]